MEINDSINWSTRDKMISNESIINSMLVTGKRLIKKMEKSYLQLHFTKLEQVDSHKLLVVTIDNQLTLPLTNILMIYARS